MDRNDSQPDRAQQNPRAPPCYLLVTARAVTSPVASPAARPAEGRRPAAEFSRGPAAGTCMHGVSLCVCGGAGAYRIRIEPQPAGSAVWLGDGVGHYAYQGHSVIILSTVNK